MKFGLVILAAGKSERFGDAEKLLSDLSGKPLVSYAVSNVPKSRFRRILAVASSDEVAERLEQLGIETVTYPGGPVSESIKTGLLKLLSLCGGDEPDYVMFLNADRPFVRTETIEKMIGAAERNPGMPVRISWKGNPGNPVMFPKEYFPLLLSLSGENGGASLLRGKETVYAEAESRYELFDINTASDLSEAAEIMEAEKQNV